MPPEAQLPPEAQYLIDNGFPPKTVALRWGLDGWDGRPYGDSVLAKAEAAADRIASGSSPGIALVGHPGRGKTTIAVAMAWRIIAGNSFERTTPLEALCVRWGDFVAKWHQTAGARQNRGKPGDFPAARGARDIAVVPVLFLDDLGIPGDEGTVMGRRLFQEVLWPRYDRGLPVVVTTGCTEQQLAVQFGDAAVSRLREMCEWVVLDGPDWRRV